MDDTVSQARFLRCGAIVVLTAFAPHSLQNGDVGPHIGVADLVVSPSGRRTLSDLPDGSLKTIDTGEVGIVGSPQPIRATRRKALAAFLSGSALAAESRLRAGLAIHSGSPELWADLAAVQYWEASSRAASSSALGLVRAVEGARRALEADGSFVNATSVETLALQNLGVIADVAPPIAASQYASADQRRESPTAYRWREIRERLADVSISIAERDLNAWIVDGRQPVREIVEEVLFGAWSDARLSGRLLLAGELLQRIRMVVAQLEPLHDGLLTRTMRDAAGAEHGLRLAEALKDFANGRKSYEGTHRELAHEQLSRSLRRLERLRSPFALRAALHVAGAAYQLGRRDDAERLATQTILRARRSPYISVLAGALWILGIAEVQKGSVDDAIVHFDEAAALFASINERQDLAAVNSSAANALRMIGDSTRGWSYLQMALADMSYVVAARRRHTILLNASLFAADEGLDRAALLFQTASLGAAFERGTANSTIEALVRRATILLRLGQIQRARDDLKYADLLMVDVTSPSVRAYVGAWSRRAEADALALESSPDTIRALDIAAEEFARAEPAELSGLLLVKARFLARRGSASAAALALRSAIRVFEERRAALQELPSRIDYQNVGAELYDELLDLQSKSPTADSAELFELMEGARSAWLDRESSGRRVGPRQLAESLDQRSVVLYYASLKDRLLVWVVTAQSTRYLVRTVSRASVAELVLQLRRAIETDSSDLPEITRRVSEMVIADALVGIQQGSLIVVVPDAELGRVPFGALVDVKTGKFLIEDYEVAIAASAQSLQRARRKRTNLQEAALVVGVEQAPGQPRLRAVRREVESIGALYPGAVVLIGNDAGFDNVFNRLGAVDMFHFAGHARTSDTLPWESRLFFAPSRGHPSGVVSAADVVRANLRGVRTVVLSACETADGRALRGTGVVSVASAFLAQGVDEVVASLWPVEDEASSQQLVEFHRRRIASGSSVAALRAIQAEMANSADSAARQPRTWAAFVVAIGGGT